MTTVRFLSRPHRWWANAAGVVLPAVLVLLPGLPLSAQQPSRHWLHAGAMPPGAIGAQRLLRSGPLSIHPRPAHVQPTLITAGDQAANSQLDRPAPVISIATGGGFSAGQYGQMLVGLQVGRPYRLRVTGVPNYESVDVYPTIELIDRLHPPPGKALRFPVPIELTTEELRLAAEGAFVTRVIYVEDPNQALPIEQREGQPYVEVRPDQDPLIAADRLGRPIAILRIGARSPGAAGLSQAFTFGDPPAQLYDHLDAAP